MLYVLRQVAGQLDAEPVRETSRVLPPVSSHQHYLCDILPCPVRASQLATTDDPRDRDGESPKLKEESRENDDVSEKKDIWKKSADASEKRAAKMTTKLVGSPTKDEISSRQNGKREDVANGLLGKSSVVRTEKSSRRTVEDESNDTESSSAESLSSTSVKYPVRGQDVARDDSRVPLDSDEGLVETAVAKTRGSDSSTGKPPSDESDVTVPSDNIARKVVRKPKSRAPTKKQIADENAVEMKKAPTQETKGMECMTSGKAAETKFESPVKSTLNEVVRQHLFNTPRKAVLDDSESEGEMSIHDI